MNVDGVHYRSIWFDEDRGRAEVIDQRDLPHRFRTVALTSRDDFARAITEMWVRGAPLIGATAAYGVAADMATDPTDANLDAVCRELAVTRPTAVNLRWALDRCKARLTGVPEGERASVALALADEIADEDVEVNRSIGANGLALIEELAAAKPAGEPVNILTHCNAGWLATVDWGTATSPIYQAHDKGLPVHVWVDETRPRNQGALTSWELGRHGVAHTYVVDNAGGHLMQHGQVDLVIVGTDRTTARGDVCNKIGTYLKALAAKDNGVPFYVALPSSTIDWTVSDGLTEIPIEGRDANEVTHVFWGKDGDGDVVEVQLTPDGTGADNPAFDVTPAHLVTGLITERGICDASAAGLAGLFPDRGVPRPAPAPRPPIG